MKTTCSLLCVILTHATKATGCDEIEPKILKIFGSSLYKPLLYLFTKSLQYCQMPTDWLTHIIVPVYKSEERRNLISKTIDQYCY